MRRHLSALLIPLLLPATLSAEPGTLPKPADFAFGMELRLIEGAAALYELPLPPEIYRTATDPGLADLRVFNAAGEVVPHLLRRPEEPATPGAAIPLPLFPVFGSPAAKEGGLFLEVHQDAAGAIVRVDSGPSAATPLLGYLLDAGGLDTRIAGLELAWPEQETNLLAQVAVDASDDLKQWTRLVEGATVADLRHEGHLLRQGTIRFAPVRSRYFRLSVPGRKPAFPLNAAAALQAPRATPLPRQWSEVQAVPLTERPGEFILDTGAHYPTDRVQIRLPEANSLVQVELFSRETKEGNWQLRGAAQVYRLNAGAGELTSPELSFSPATDRFWRLRLDASTGGVGSSPPQLQFGWVPHRLLFVARGAAPFLLAYGSATATAVLPEPGLREWTTGTSEKIVPGMAEPGPRIVLGGEGRLQPPAPPLPWREWLLWGVLVTGVGLLAWMAARLLRQMEREKAAEEKKAEP